MKVAHSVPIMILLSSLGRAHSLAQIAPELRPPANLQPPSSGPAITTPPLTPPAPTAPTSGSPFKPPRSSPTDADSEAAVTLVTKNNLKFILALLAGWADVACFRQYKCFGIMMTGNNIKMAMSFAEKNRRDTVFYGMLIVYYVTGVCIFRCVDHMLTSISQRVVALPIFLLCFATDVLLHYFPKERWHMFLLVTAFGAVNGVSTGKVSAVTCMMTGHLHKLGNDLVDYLMKGPNAAKKLKPMANIGVIASFCVGLLSGAAAVRYNWMPNFPKFTFLGVCYCTLLMLFDVKVKVRRRNLHHNLAHDEVHGEGSDGWKALFERPREPACEIKKE